MANAANDHERIARNQNPAQGIQHLFAFRQSARQSARFRCTLRHTNRLAVIKGIVVHLRLSTQGVPACTARKPASLSGRVVSLRSAVRRALHHPNCASASSDPVNRCSVLSGPAQNAAPHWRSLGLARQRGFGRLQRGLTLNDVQAHAERNPCQRENSDVE